MYNCVINKIKESIDNANLKKLGIIEWTYNTIGLSEGKRTFVLGGEIGSPLNVSISNESDTTEYKLSKKGFISIVLPEASNISIKIDGKYYIESLGVNNGFNGFKFDVSELVYNEHLKSILQGEYYGSIDAFKDKAELVTFDINDNKIYGDISSLSNCININSINVYRNTNIYGNIESLGKCTKLTSLNIANTILNGDISNLANKMVSNGRTNGTLKIICASKNIVTYEGSIVTSPKTISFSENGYNVL